jgi:DNA-binding SARP family transcriptional activator
MATLTLFLFGAPRLECDGAVVKIPRRKALALLAYLASTGQSHARDTLATLFWPDHSQSEARLRMASAIM